MQPLRVEMIVVNIITIIIIN